MRLAIPCVLVVVGWGSSAGAWDTTAGSDTNYGSITFGGTGTDYSYGVAVDGSGNVYATGYFEGTVDFGAGDVTSAGGRDGFVTKYNAAGVHQWTNTFGSDLDAAGQGVAVDSAGNVYVTGYFVGIVDFGSGDVRTLRFSTVEVFVTKYNAAGVHQWTDAFGGVSGDSGKSVAVDGSGNVYVTGVFRRDVDFGEDYYGSRENDADAFVTKYNAAGVHQWAKAFMSQSAGRGRWGGGGWFRQRLCHRRLLRHS